MPAAPAPCRPPAPAHERPEWGPPNSTSSGPTPTLRWRWMGGPSTGDAHSSRTIAGRTTGSGVAASRWSASPGGRSRRNLWVRPCRWVRRWPLLSPGGRRPERDGGGSSDPGAATGEWARDQRASDRHAPITCSDRRASDRNSPLGPRRMLEVMIHPAIREEFIPRQPSTPREPNCSRYPGRIRLPTSPAPSRAESFSRLATPTGTETATPSLRWLLLRQGLGAPTPWDRVQPACIHLAPPGKATFFPRRVFPRTCPSPRASPNSR